MNAEEKDLLHRHLNGDLDASEQAAFFGRLQSSPELRRELASHAMDEMLISEIVLEGRTTGRTHARRRAWIPGAVAAALLLGLSLILSLGRGASTGLRVVAVEGATTLRRGDLDKPLMAGTELRVGDVVATVRGRATLESSGTLVEVRDQSALAVRDAGRLYVERGRVEARADGLVLLFELGSARLRKANVRVDVSAERTRIEAEEGSVVVERADLPAVELDARQYARLAPEQLTTTGRLVPRSAIDDAVRRGATFLESRRNDIVTPITSEKRHGAAPRRTYAELALLALHRAGTSSSHPMMADLLGFVKGRSLESTYAAALQAMVLAEIDPAAHRDRIRQCGQFLIDSQCANGQWDYFGAKLSEPPPDGPLRRRSEGPASGDNSVSSYAALGLYACVRAGVEIDRDVVARALLWWRICQNGDGGWGYNDSGDRTPGDGGKRTNTSNASYGSATASALAAMSAMSRVLDWGPSKKAIRRGQDWLDANFGVARNPGKDPGFVHLHWLVSAARAAEFLSTEQFGSHDWYLEGAEFLIGAQLSSGEWRVEQGEFMKGERNDVLDTCLAILFLRRAP